MKKQIYFLCLSGIFLFGCNSRQASENSKTTTNTTTTSTSSMSKSFYDLSAKTIDGNTLNFSTLKGKKLLIVNTASECGYTPQYADLQELHKKYGSDKFMIIGFPCNDFGGQEPGSNSDVKSFCSKNYGVTFQMMEKVNINSEPTSPVYLWLKSKSLNDVEDAHVKWNFNKFLIDENGKYVRHLDSNVKPEDPQIVSWINGK